MKKVILLFLLGVISYDINAQSKIVTKQEFDSDSLLQLRRIEFLKPAFIANFIGTSFATKTKLENDLQLVCIGSSDGIIFYNVNGNNIGLLYFKGKKEEVCIELSLRLFGEEGAQYEALLIKNGFVLRTKKQTSNLELEGDLSSQVRSGSVRIYKKDDVVCEVIEGSYLSFSFYRRK